MQPLGQFPAWNDDDISLVLNRIKDTCINCLAIDFDKTLICKHTASKWKGEANSLAKFVRPLFLSLIPKAIQAGDLFHFS